MRRSDADDEALLALLALRLKGRIEVSPLGIAVFSESNPTRPVAFFDRAAEAVEFLEQAFADWQARQHRHQETTCPG